MFNALAIILHLIAINIWVYVVTITPEFDDAVHERWPRILSGN